MQFEPPLAENLVTNPATPGKKHEDGEDSHLLLY
jgi:hypothetical protein